MTNINLPYHFRQECQQSRKLLRRSCDTDFIGPGWGLAVVGDRIFGCRRRCRLLLCLFTFVPLSPFGGLASAHPCRKLQARLWREGPLQNFEDALDLQAQRGSEKTGKRRESENTGAEVRKRELSVTLRNSSPRNKKNKQIQSLSLIYSPPCWQKARWDWIMVDELYGAILCV